MIDMELRKAGWNERTLREQMELLAGKSNDGAEVLGQGASSGLGKEYRGVDLGLQQRIVQEQKDRLAHWRQEYMEKQRERLRFDAHVLSVLEEVQGKAPLTREGAETLAENINRSFKIADDRLRGIQGRIQVHEFELRKNETLLKYLKKGLVQVLGDDAALGHDLEVRKDSQIDFSELVQPNVKRHKGPGDKDVHEGKRKGNGVMGKNQRKQKPNSNRRR